MNYDVHDSLPLCRLGYELQFNQIGARTLYFEAFKSIVFLLFMSFVSQISNHTLVCSFISPALRQHGHYKMLCAVLAHLYSDSSHGLSERAH